jgi:hypothetical protein
VRLCAGRLGLALANKKCTSNNLRPDPSSTRPGLDPSPSSSAALTEDGAVVRRRATFAAVTAIMSLARAAQGRRLSACTVGPHMRLVEGVCVRLCALHVCVYPCVCVCVYACVYYVGRLSEAQK